MSNIKHSRLISNEDTKLEKDQPILLSKDRSLKENTHYQTPDNLSRSNEFLPGDSIKRKIFIDAGIEQIHVRIYDMPPMSQEEILTNDLTIANNDDIRKLFTESGVMKLLDNNNNGSANNENIYITGKLSEITKKVLKRGEAIMPAAVLWSAAKSFLNQKENTSLETIGVLDLSASGYMVICVDKSGGLKDDLLIVNPRCGAGTGVNLSRILEKLDIDHEQVDRILVDYLGREGKDKREQIPVRADRCGVFSSSATISDKNQGIPLDYALAVTMKSEVKKPCNKMAAGTDKVYLTGGVFKWQYARDCAEDLLKANGTKEIIFDEKQEIMMTGMEYLVESVGENNFRKQNSIQLRKSNTLIELPSFIDLKEKYENERIYERLPDTEVADISPEIFVNLAVNVGLDIGSTMAKIVINDVKTGKLIFKNSYNNHGDTIETIKHIFRKLKSNNINKLKIQNIGITGSGRYQVQKALKAVYPHLNERIFVQVENYAHARGSIQYAKDHITKLKSEGYNDVNEDFYLLVDIGGEDTKISVVSLKKEELFDNAMNLKCSAGTGSLMDTLKSLFNIEDIADAYFNAFEAAKAYGINATCAVFLMENARKMQADGYGKDEILASCCHAIVENMARSLWDQVEFPDNTLILLHGQTMLSDPLPLAVTHRAQEYMSSKTYCLVPPFPGHRACLGLIQNIGGKNLPEIDEYCNLNVLLDRQFDKKIIVCHGVACGDKNARCARTKLRSEDDFGKLSLTLGGCTAINELQSLKQKGEKIKIPEAYKEIWKFVDGKLAKSIDKNRLVIPRSFAVSEKAFFFGKIFEQFGIAVHIDTVQERDIIEGQPLFTIDTCAPNIGAAGQFLRLAREQHGIILVPQIDFLPIEGKSIGRTCTTNQGGVLIAHHFANMKYPEARFKLFDISLKKSDPRDISDQLYKEFQSIFEYYNVNITRNRLTEAIVNAEKEYKKLKEEIAEIAANYIEEAINKKLNVSIVSAREYILNPGIYDSHIGKLLKDKGVVAIPTYVFEIFSDKQFDYIYWKNPHDLMNIANAISKKRFHQIIKHPRLKKLIKKIETGNAEILMSIVTVSTFRCGPDSITLPILSEVTKNIPTLLIQSDAMIAELAHLENRVNTHLNQLNKSLHNELSRKDKSKFSIKILDQFLLDGLDKETDVIYFPTANDNRPLTAIFRAAGLTVIDNYDDDSYDLEEKAKMGRKYIGDSACVPLAAVFSDMLNSVDDFNIRKKANDPLVKGKERVVLFMHSGDGPCRQGQYVDICKLNFYKIFGKSDFQPSDSQNGRFPVKFLLNVASSLSGEKDFLSGIEKWTVVQAFHAFVVKGVLHSVYLKASSNCMNYEEFEKLKLDFRKLKQTVYKILENDFKPGKFFNYMVKKIEQKIPRLSGVAQYFGYGLYNNNGLRKIFKEFADRWIDNHFNGENSGKHKINIHVEGEIYLRVAQIDEILKSLVDSLGFGAFNLNYTPMWSFLEYVLESRILIANKDIKMYRDKLNENNRDSEKTKLLELIEEKKENISSSAKTISNLRNILAAPLYKAAALEVPGDMKHAIKMAEPVIPKYKPFGELVPYIGETISQLNNGTNLVLNVAPEGCMVASMGEMLSPKIMQIVDNNNSRIQFLFTTDGEINEDLLRLSLLKILAPERYYSR